MLAWTKNLILYLLLSSLLLNLAPSNNSKKYIQFVSGIIIILLMLDPVFFILRQNPEQIMEEFFSPNAIQIAETFGQAGNSQNYVCLGISEAIRIGLTEKQEESELLVGVTYTIDRVTVITDEKQRLVGCTIYGRMNREAALAIKTYINQVYNLEFEHINIVKR